MEIITTNCPSCGAVYGGNITSRFITCEYCGTRFALSEDEARALGIIEGANLEPQPIVDPPAPADAVPMYVFGLIATGLGEAVVMYVLGLPLFTALRAVFQPEPGPEFGPDDMPPRRDPRRR